MREIRAPKHNAYGHTASGYFDSPEELAAAAARYDGRANIFVTLNPVLPDLLARSFNRLADKAEYTTADLETQKRCWLFLDIDPDRPSGISSTNEESEAALSVVESVVSFLSLEGWPAPVTAMSGNGYYALYRLDLPNDDRSKSLLKAVLGTLADRFNTPRAHIDQSVHNAARIVGLIGTIKMKGDATPERPHRRSSLLSVPDELSAVTAEQLEALNPEQAAPPMNPAASGVGGQSLVNLLERRGIEYREQPPDANGITWYHVRRCPFHEDGRDFECGVGQKLPDGPYAGHCFHPEGQDRGWREWKLALDLETSAKPPLLNSAQPTPLRTTDFHRTDSGNAEMFTQLYGDRVRFDHRRGRWLLWGDHHWREDIDGAVYRLAKEAVRQRYLAALSLDDLDERAVQAKFAVASENRQRLEALLALARNELPISNAGDAWDSNEWLLGVSDGVVDLRTGHLLPGDPGQMITQFAPVRYDPLATCPRWLQFLAEVFEDDTELIDFICKAVGHSLTGDISEQCLFICHGVGSNGKSVFLVTLRSLSGSYAYNSPFSTFELHSRSSIPNDVAPLASKRLVTASEVNDGTRLNEARLKALTGGDPITARFLNHEFFTFVPEAKFWLAVNHRPKVEDLSYGFWRRVRLIPFNRTFVTDQDKKLVERLQRELPGIFAWAVQGCLAWQQDGLGVPRAVIEATETYRTESDPLSQFLEECCVIRPDLTCGATEVYLEYVRWTASQGMKESEKLTSTKFGTKLGARFEKKRKGRGNVYVGLALLAAHPDPEPNPTRVQGSVYGSGPDVGLSEVLAQEKSVTREDQELPYTTLHPTQSPPTNDGGRGGENHEVRI